MIMRKGVLLLVAATFLAPAGRAWSIPFWNWRGYGSADGMTESACVSVQVGPNGTVWVNHPGGAGISALNGYNVATFPSPGSGDGRIYDSPARQLWTVVPEGLKEFNTEFPGATWVTHPVPVIATNFAASGQHSLHPIPLCPVRQGLVFFLVPDGLMEFRSEEEKRPSHSPTTLYSADESGLGRFFGMTPGRDGRLWIAGARGLARSADPVRLIKPDSRFEEHLPPDALQIENLQEPQPDEDGGVTCVADSRNGRQKVVVHFDGQAWTKFPAASDNVRLAWRGPEKRFWAATTNSVFQLAANQAGTNKDDEISAREYFDVSVEPSGNFWLATSDGLFRYAPQTWRTPAYLQNVSADIECLTDDPEGRLWFASSLGLHVLRQETSREIPFAGAAAGLLSVRALFPVKNGMIWLDAGRDQILFHPESDSYNTVTNGEPGRHIEPLGLLADGSLCVQLSDTAGGAPHCQLATYDGAGFGRFPYPLPDPASEECFSGLYAEPNGDLWLSGERGTARYHEGKWRVFNPTVANAPEKATCFAETADGRMWCATQDKIWRFDGLAWSVPRTWPGGISALVRGGDGNPWLVSNGALYRYLKNAWVENGLDEGLPSAAVRKVFQDRRGRVWAATTRGLSLYHPEADTDPPQMLPFGEKEARINEGATFNLTFTGEDKWKFTPRERLLYSYRLDAGDATPYSAGNSIALAELPAGKHYFEARAMDRNGNEEATPTRLEFSVVLPWYKQPALVGVSVAALAVAFSFALLAFNRHQRLVRSYAEVEQKVAQRTLELERANRELFQSQKMNALGTLSAGIAHDFNNILSIVKGSAQIIEDNLENPQKISTRVDRIKTVAEQGAGIVKAMLGFSRTSDQQPAVCDLNAVVGETIKLLGDRFLREVEVRLTPAPDLPRFPASSDFIQQILLNFIFNAAEATQDRREILLQTGLLPAVPRELVLQPAPAAAHLFVSVKDHGCGIAAETLPRIFEPFFTTKALSARRGTGLGLSMAYELARKLGAGLAVESAPGQGSTFTLILPVRDLPVDAGP